MYNFFCVATGFEIGTTKNKSSKRPEQDSNPGLRDCECDVLTTWPHWRPSFTCAPLMFHAYCSHYSCSTFSIFVLEHIAPRNVTKVQQGPGISTGYYKHERVSLICGTADRRTAEPAEPTEPKEMTVLLQLPLVNMIK